MSDAPALYALNASVYGLEDLTQTQSNSQPSQDIEPVRNELDAQSWGLLIPCVPGMEVKRFLKSERRISIGRDPKSSVKLIWTCTSATHAFIDWNGVESERSVVTITDKSRNGTYVKGEKIGRGCARILLDGYEVSFGAPGPSTRENQPDCRFTFRDLVSVQRELYKKYDLSKQLGQGAYARVYQALNKRTGRWVAVKMISATMRHNLSPPVTEAPLIREIEIMRSFSHPNICEMEDFFENPDRSIDLVLEYVDGGNLYSFIANTNNGEGLSDWMSCHLTYQICKALAHIHSHKITHRDLKPENILLTKQTPPIVKIADFGLAKFVDENTALRTMCGTPTYTAPEILMRLSTDPPYTNLVDSWSVGVIMSLMFTLKTPFPPKIPIETLKHLISERQLDWEYLRLGHVSEPGFDFVIRLLQIDPAERMTLEDAQYHPWLTAHKPTYELKYPEAGASLATTASMDNVDSNPSAAPQRRAPTRAATEDPYADCDLQEPNAYAGPARLAAAAPSGKLPHRGAPVAGQRLPGRTAGMQGIAQSSTEFLYGPPPARSTAQPGPSGGAKKRTRALMHMADSSPLTSLSSIASASPPPPPPPKKKTKTVAAAARAAAPRKAKGKKREDPDPSTTTATRRSTRTARPVKR